MVFVLSKRVKWIIRWPWKNILKIWPKVKVMIWPENFMLHISRCVSSAYTHLWYFHRSNLSLSTVIAEKLLVTFHHHYLSSSSTSLLTKSETRVWRYIRWVQKQKLKSKHPVCRLKRNRKSKRNYSINCDRRYGTGNRWKGVRPDHTPPPRGKYVF